MRASFVIFFLLATLAVSSYGQAPVILNAEPVSTYPQDTIVITGSGFSNTPAMLQVWFDQVKGTIISSSEYSIKVKVPVNTRFTTIEVINLTTRLSGKAPFKFMPSYKTAPVSSSSFSLAQTFSNSSEVWDICNCDLNNDNKPDLVITKSFDPANDIMVLENQSTPGNINFSRTEKAMGFPTDGIMCNDLNGDGKPDLVAARSGNVRNTIHIMPNTSAGSISFGATVNLTLETDPQSVKATRVALNDLNGDGKPEIIVTDQSNGRIYIFKNNSTGGTLTIDTTPIKITVPGATSTYEVEVQDFNGDKFPDIALTQLQINHVFILKNLGASDISFAPAQQISVSGSLNRLVSADLNKDGLLDLVSTSTITPTRIFVLYNQSTPSTFSFRTPVQLTTSSGPWGIDVSDIEGDGDPDILVANREQNLVNVFIHNGNFSSPTFTRTDITHTKNTRNIKAGDLDGDGKPDLVVTSLNNAAQYSTDILRNIACHQPSIINQELSICPGQTLRLETMPGNNVEFTWRQGAAVVKTGTEHFLNVTTADTYSVTASGTQTGAGVVATEAGCALQDSKVISVGTGTMPGKPVITANSPICSGSALNLSTGPAAGATYEWSGPDGFTASIQNPSIPNVTSDNAGLYRLTVTVGDCHNEAEPVIVDIADLDNFSISSNSATNAVCSGGNVSLSVQSLANHTYQWYRNGAPTGDKSITGATSSSYSASIDDSYWVKITNTALSNCSTQTSTVAVKILAPPVASFTVSDTDVCTGSQLQFTSTSAGDTLAGRGVMAYSWNFTNGTSTLRNPLRTYASAGTFNATLTVSYTGVSGCSDVSDVTAIKINAPVQPAITATKEAICEEEESTLSITGSFTSATWSTAQTGNSITVDTPGSYSVNTIDTNGCSGSDDITIDSRPLPVISITINGQARESISIATGTSVQLEASGADTYLWSPVDGLDNSTIANPLATPTISTTYQVTGSVTDGCSSTAQVQITIDGSKLDVDIPVAFSPNGDTQNPTWIILRSENYPDCSVNVFDGRGRRIYQQKGIIEWDGTSEGKPVPAGTYFYVYGCPDNRTMTGSVLVLK